MTKLLSNIRVLDITRMLAGPYASMLLADMGAEVIKIEEPEVGDEIRRMGPPFINDVSAYFIAINRNKKSLTLNLKSEKGREIFYKLVSKSDVVLDNFRPGILKKLECDYETLKHHNPKIISCSLTSFGEEGELKDLPAFDLIIQAFSGAMSITGEPGHPPVRLGIPMGDLAGGLLAGFAISSALLNREKTGKGCSLNLSLLDCLVSLLTYVAQYYFADGVIPQPQGSKHMSCVPYGLYKTRDSYIVIGVFTEKFWEGFCRAIEYTELIKDERFDTNVKRVENRDILEPMLENILSQKTGEEWLKRLYEEGVPSAPVNTLREVFEMPQILEHGMVIDVKHPVAGTVKTLGYPIKVDNLKDLEICPSPLLGEHNNAILKTVLGFSDKEIAKLHNEKVI